MERIVKDLERPLTDLMPKDIFIFLLTSACLTMPPGSAILNLIIIGYWQWRSPISQTTRLLSGLYMNLDKQPSFHQIADRYDELKSKKRMGLTTPEEKKELKRIKQTIIQLVPKPRYLLSKYYPSLLVGAIGMLYSFYKLYTLFPETMKLLFGESIWQHLK